MNRKLQLEEFYSNFPSAIYEKIRNNEETSPQNSSHKKINKNLHKIKGTPDYIAPEIIKESGHLNDTAIDWWSVGIILFEFIVGVPPFNDETPEKIFDNIVNNRFDWSLIKIGYEEDCMTPETKEVILGLLEMNPKKRWGIKELKQAKFFQSDNLIL